jgi:hypothetical protein
MLLLHVFSTSVSEYAASLFPLRKRHAWELGVYSGPSTTNNRQPAHHFVLAGWTTDRVDSTLIEKYGIRSLDII